MYSSATMPMTLSLRVPARPMCGNLHDNVSFSTPQNPYYSTINDNVVSPQFYHYPPLRHLVFPSCLVRQYDSSKDYFSDFNLPNTCPVQNSPIPPLAQVENDQEVGWLWGNTKNLYDTHQDAKNRQSFTSQEDVLDEFQTASSDSFSSNFSPRNFQSTPANVKFHSFSNLQINVKHEFARDEGKPSTDPYHRGYGDSGGPEISNFLTQPEKLNLNSKSFFGIEGLNPPSKKRRRNSEKRKEKSRDAARCRRGKESEIFSELGKLLPLSCSVGTSLDKASIIRVAIAYLRTRNLATYVLSSCMGSNSSCCQELPVGLVEPEETPDDVLLQSLDGFLLVLTKEGDIIYTSENISSYLGVSQVDVMGQSLLDYAHPCDHDEVRHITSSSKVNDWTHCFVRLKSTLTTKGRNVNLKSATYRVVQMTGQVLDSRKGSDESQSDPNSQPWVVALGVPVPHPSNIEVPLDKQTFVSKHSLDMKFTYVDENVFNFCGYGSNDLLGRSLYEMNHALDTPLILDAYKILRAKGQVETGRYRFLSHGGGFVWVVTQATLITGHKDNKPQYVVCLNYVISEVISPDVIFSEYQLQTSIANPFVGSSVQGSHSVDSSPAASPPSPPPTPPIPKLIRDPSLHKSCPKKASVSCRPSPVAATFRLLRDRTEDTNEGYLTFINDDPRAAVLKEEPEDLTHLAPSGGEDCVPLEIPTFLPTIDDFLVENQSSFQVSSSTQFHQGLTAANVKTSVRSHSDSLTPTNISGKKDFDASILRLCYKSAVDPKSSPGPRVVPQSHQKQTFSAFSRFGGQGLRYPISHKVPDREEASPLALEGFSPRQRFNTPEPPRTPTPLLSQVASPLVSESKRHLSASFSRPAPTVATYRPFAELNSHSTSMDFLSNLDLKLEDDLDMRLPYMPDIDDVPFFGTDDIFLSNSSQHSNRSSLNDDEESHSSTKSLERGNSPFGLSSQYMDTSHSFHNQKSNADTGGGFVDPNQVLPGQNIKGEEGEDSSHELRYLLDGPPPSPVKETVEPPPPLKPRLSVKRGLSPQVIPSVSRKRIRPPSLCLGRCPPAPTRKEPSPLLPPPHSPIMQQLLVSKEPIQIRARALAQFERRTPSGGVSKENKKECSSSSSHSVLRNLLVSGRDDMEGYNVASGSSTDNLLSSPESPQSSDGASDKSGDEMCSTELDSLASIPLNRDGKVELTREQLSVLLSKAGVLRNSLNGSSHNNTLQKTPTSYSSSSFHFTAMDKPFILVDPNLTIPSLLDLTSQDCEVNAPAPTPSLLHGADLLMALDRSQ